MSDWLIQRIADFGNRPFLSRHGDDLTYGQLAEAIARSRRTLEESGVVAGDVVILRGDYTLEGIAALLALFQIKAIAAPIASASSDEARQRAEAARAVWQANARETLQITALQSQDPPHDLVEALRSEKDSGLILFSSGSTGQPKAMIHNANQLLAPFARKRARRLVILIFLLFDHIGGLNTLFNGIATGAHIVVPDSRDPHVVAEAIKTHGVKLLPASPTFLNLMLMSGALEKFDLSSLRYVTYGTEPMPESLLARLKKKMPNVALIQTFGTSETGISQTTSQSSSSTLIKFDDPNTEFKVVHGELWLRSKSQILGYLNHEMSRFTPDGWFKTGDIVVQDENGFFRIVGRREELINVGGEKVSPNEVESVLLEMPEIADCVVYGQSNSITGQNVAAEIVAPGVKNEARKEFKRRIKSHCRTKLSSFKVPARLCFTDQAAFSERFKKQRPKAR